MSYSNDTLSLYPRYATQHDICILAANAAANVARDAKSLQYVRVELKQRLESLGADVRSAYINKCNAIKKELSNNNKDFENICKETADALVVDAVLGCRKDMGCFKQSFLRTYIQQAFKKYYGVQM